MKRNAPPPPRWLDRLLTYLVAPHLREEVLGDLHERHALRVQRLGEANARRRYWREVLPYVRLQSSDENLNDTLLQQLRLCYATISKSPSEILLRTRRIQPLTLAGWP